MKSIYFSEAGSGSWGYKLLTNCWEFLKALIIIFFIRHFVVASVITPEKLKWCESIVFQRSTKKHRHKDVAPVFHFDMFTSWQNKKLLGFFQLCFSQRPDFYCFINSWTSWQHMGQDDELEFTARSPAGKNTPRRLAYRLCTLAACVINMFL